MPFSIKEISSLLSCPDDEAPMAAGAGGIRCERCHRFYPLLSTNILELLPSRPIDLPDRGELAPYREGYRREFFRPLKIRADAKAWGAPEARSRKWLRLRERQAREVFEFLRDEPCEANLVFCDLSAGAGYCTFRAAQEYRLVFHCDLSMDALAYASAKARASHLENIIFVHADYFQPPFRNSIDHLTCLDTLIRGAWHETKLLRNIQSVLASGGAAVVDFHNWWHNPLRRLGLLPDNFVGNKSYTRKELTGLLANSGIGQFETRPFVQEVDPCGAPGKMLMRFIPPTRLMVRMAGMGAVNSQTVSARSQAARA
ncbi:MAG: class I SAM-dependent methyltransferase [Candidatus Acidiferrales bacterium]